MTDDPYYDLVMERDIPRRLLIDILKADFHHGYCPPELRRTRRPHGLVQAAHERHIGGLRRRRNLGT